jgi:hypothetical protein
VRLPAPLTGSQLPDRLRAVLQAQFAGRDNVPVAEVQQAIREDPSPELRELLVHHLQGGRAEPEEAVHRQIAERAAEAAGLSIREAADPEGRQLFELMDRRLIGQERIKEGLYREIQMLLSPFITQPGKLVLAGPPGVGKTSAGEAAAMALNGGDMRTVFLIKLADLQNRAEVISTFKGAPKGYVGYEKNDPGAAIPFDRIQEVIASGKIPIFVWDEWEKMPVDVEDEVVNRLTNYLQDGKWATNSGDTIDLRKSLNIFTSNAGHDKAHLYEGDAEALREHYIRSMRQAFRHGHWRDRLQQIESAENLNPSELKQITALELDKAFAQARELAAEAGLDGVTFNYSEATLHQLADIGFTSEGARRLQNIIQKLVFPQIAPQLRGGKTEARFVLTEAGDAQRRVMEADFRRAGTGIPASYSAQTFPIKFVDTYKATKLSAYDGRIPHSELARLLVLGSAAAKGRGHILINRGEFDSPNELLVHIPGARQGSSTATSRDDFQPVPGFPEELARANAQLDMVELEGDRLFLSAVHRPDEGDAEVHAFIYHSTGERKGEFEEVPPLQEPLVGASTGAIGDEVLVFGGRRLERDPAGQWSVSANLADNSGIASEPFVYRYKVTTGEWSELDERSSPDSLRSGAAVVRQNGKLYFIGGEETVPTFNGVFVSRASTRVDIYDPTTGAFTRGEDLEVPTAYATAISDPNGGILVLGGCKLTPDGTQEAEEQSVVQRINLDSPNPKWKVAPELRLPAPATQVAAVPHPQGNLLFPFFPPRQDGDGDPTVLTPEGRLLGV